MLHQHPLQTENNNNLIHPSLWELRHQVGNPSCTSQNLLSSSTCDTAATKLGAMPSKTQRFRCFQSVQAPKIIKELRTFLDGLGALMRLLPPLHKGALTWLWSYLLELDFQQNFVPELLRTCRTHLRKSYC
jgi:hypothetical protein